MNLDDALHLQGDSLLAGSFGLDDIVGEAQDAPIKKFRVAGGRVAVAKKISADLDSDDDMLVQMREAGCTDMQIADALANSGRVRYDKKTIASRYARIKDKMARREDQRLEDELTDWHEGEVRDACTQV